MAGPIGLHCGGCCVISFVALRVLFGDSAQRHPILQMRQSSMHLFSHPSLTTSCLCVEPNAGQQKGLRLGSALGRSEPQDCVLSP